MNHDIASLHLVLTQNNFLALPMLESLIRQVDPRKEPNG